MRKNLSIWMLGIAAVLASCSSEDTLQGTSDNDGLVRITVQLEDGMKTRAATPEESGESANVTRFVLSAYETTEDGTIQQKATDVVITPLGSGSFTAKLDRQKYYKFFCWADEGENSSYSITGDDLENIALKQNTDGTAGYMLPTIAHRGESSVVYGETADEVPIQLKHAVAKVMLQTTGTLTAGSAKLETKTCTNYNAVTNLYDNDTKESVSKSGPEADVTGSEDTPADVLKFYVMTGRTTENVVLTYTSDGREYTKKLNSVSFENDYRTIFVGDIAGLQYNDVSVKATLDENWDDDKIENIAFNVTSKSADDLLRYLNNTVGNKTGMTVRLSGTLTGEHFTAALREFLSDHEDANLTLDLSQTKNTTIPRYAFYYTDWVDSQVKTWDSKGLSSIILPECLTTIEPWAFKGCSNLKSVDLTHVTNIGRYAFNGCSSLSDITFPKGDFNIQGGVFTETAWLKQFSEFTIPSTWIFADDYGYGLLHESHIVSVTIPKDYKGSYAYLLCKTESLESVTIEGDITSISEACFHLCKKLTTLDLSACTQVPAIENYAFGGVDNETDVTQITVYVKDADMEAKFEAEDSPWIKQGFTKEKIQVKP